MPGGSLGIALDVWDLLREPHDVRVADDKDRRVVDAHGWVAPETAVETDGVPAVRIDASHAGRLSVMSILRPVHEASVDLEIVTRGGARWRNSGEHARSAPRSRE